MARSWRRTIVYVVGLIGFTCGLFSHVARADDLVAAGAPDSPARDAAIARLRSEGQPALDRLIARVAELERRLFGTEPTPAGTFETFTQLTRAIDQVGAARLCRQSGLYWHTDLEQAKQESQRTGKPILALRMLGNLTDDYSCANSRFFRTTLYSNRQIADYLRQNFVLTWKSVRPVPRITIDFGDGRRIERTVTGNSIHYVLDSQGRVIDGLPGLYGPQAFLERLQAARTLALTLRNLPPSEFATTLDDARRSTVEQIAAAWNRDLQTIAKQACDRPEAARQTAPASVQASPAPPANAAPREWLAAVHARLNQLAQATDDPTWNQISALHAADARIDDASKLLVGLHRTPQAAAAGRLAMTKRVVEDPLLALVRNLERSIALDTVKNEYSLRPRLLAWLLETPTMGADVDVLNERVYADLFLMPTDDPWLGLDRPDVYAALPAGGVVAPGTTPAVVTVP